MEKQLKGFGLFRRSLLEAPWIGGGQAEMKTASSRRCQLVRAFGKSIPPWDMRCGWSARSWSRGPAPSRYSAWLIVSLSRNQTILESGPDTTECSDARDKITCPGQKS